MNAPISAHLQSAAPVPRVAALIAFVLAVGLMVWRAGDVMLDADRPVQVSNSAEAALVNILEPVVGAGNVRASVVEAGAGRNITVLLNEAIQPNISKVSELTQTILAVDPAAGDIVSVDAVIFSGGLAGTVNRADYFELVALFVLSSICGWLAFRPKEESVSLPASANVPVSAAPHQAWAMQEVNPNPGVRGQVDSNEIDADALLQIAKQDPAKAAQIIRRWMNAGEAA